MNRVQWMDGGFFLMTLLESNGDLGKGTETSSMGEDGDDKAYTDDSLNTWAKSIMPEAKWTEVPGRARQAWANDHVKMTRDAGAFGLGLRLQVRNVTRWHHLNQRKGK